MVGYFHRVRQIPQTSFKMVLDRGDAVAGQLSYLTQRPRESVDQDDRETLPVRKGRECRRQTRFDPRFSLLGPLEDNRLFAVSCTALTDFEEK
jgi:hypothetical protein